MRIERIMTDIAPLLLIIAAAVTLSSWLLSCSFAPAASPYVAI